MQALPTTIFFVLLELAAGGQLVLLLVELGGASTGSFALVSGLLLWGSAAAALWLRASFPPAAAWPYPPDPLWSALEGGLLVALLATSGLYLASVALHASRPRRWLAWLAGAAALGALLTAAKVQAGPQLLGLGAPMSVLFGALALGAAVEGFFLGHWYLIMPRLPTGPLLRVTTVLLAALAGQVLLLAAVLAFAGTSLAPVLSEFGLFFWLRLLFGVLFPMFVGAMLWRIASDRSIPSAIGLLYVLVSLVVGGEIVSRSIFFFTGMAV